ncbi:MAG: sensor histidine kinase [Chloroflexi bacterium]|nr:sensor histidine kinase [Chloroflexota bacterium]
MASADWAAVLVKIEEQLESWRRRCEHWRRAYVPRTRASARGPVVRPDGVSVPPTVLASHLADLAADLYQLGFQVLQQADALRAQLGPAVVGYATTALAAQRQLEVAEAERMRLARNLHDGPAQQLAQAVMQVECLERQLQHDPSAAGPELAALRASLQRTAADIRRALFDLRLPAVEQFGLVALLRAYLAEFERQADLVVEAVLPPVEVALSREQVVALYRIAQEALTNVRKHARARRVLVQVADDAVRGELLLAVEDDGCGFLPSAQPPGRYGLLGMREHAALVGAHLAIDGRPGQGVRVVVRLPRRSP